MTEQHEFTLTQEAPKKRGRTKGYHHSAETRMKMAEARIGVHPSEETKEKIAKARIGFHHTEEARRKMSETRRKNFLLKAEARKKTVAKESTDAV